MHQWVGKIEPMISRHWLTLAVDHGKKQVNSHSFTPIGVRRGVLLLARCKVFEPSIRYHVLRKTELSLLSF